MARPAQGVNSAKRQVKRNVRLAVDKITALPAFRGGPKTSANPVRKQRG